MSSIKLESNASGTGVFTLASPATNTNRTLTLPDATGTIITTAGGAAISGTTGTFTGLVDISAAGAGQIKFPATQNASSDANTLDDYEEGTWTPSLQFGGGSTGMTYGARRVGFYTKIGRVVTVNCFFALTAKGSSTGAARITGLPFTAVSNDQAAQGAVMMNTVSNSGNTSSGIDTGQNFSYLYTTSTAGTRAELTDANFSNNSEFSFTNTYIV